MSVVPLFDSQIFILARPGAGVAERYLCLRLERLPRPYRVAFAAACVERHAPRLRNELSGLAGSGEEFGIALDLVWESAAHEGIDPAWLASMLLPCAETYRRQATGAEDSVSTLLACLEVAGGGECEPALRVSRCVVRALEEQAAREQQAHARHRGLVHAQWPSPLARLERERQFRDLTELQHTAATPSVNLVRRLRDRAAMESGLPTDEAIFEPAAAMRHHHYGVR